MIIKILVAVAIAQIPGVATAQERLTKAQRELIALSPEQIAAKIEVKDDPLDTVIRISSAPVYTHRQGLLKLTNGDKFFRAFIDKKTGEVTYQLYVWVTYGGGEWQNINRVNYETPNGPASVEAHRIDSDVSCGRYGCSYTEHFAFDLPEDVVREIAKGAEAGVDGQWRFRYYGRTSDAATTSMLKTEAAGFLSVVDRVRADLKPASNVNK